MTDWPQGVARLVLDEVDSTNREAQRRARAGNGPTWILAHQQADGRGRRGRAWLGAKGDFAASYLTYPSIPVARLPEYSFALALAVFETLADVTGRADRFSLKWPNDVLADGLKISGILLETATGPRGLALIAGVGVNLVAAPQATDLPQEAIPAGSLFSLFGIAVAPEEFLDILAVRMAREEAALATGFSETRSRWKTRAAGMGQTIRARTVKDSHEGIFEDIDATGALVLKTATGRLVLPAADVYFAADGQ